MLASLAGSRDGGPGIENGFTPGMHYTEKSRYSTDRDFTDRDFTLAFWIGKDDQPKTQ